MITEKERLQIKKEIECYIKKNDVLLTKELKIKLQEIYDSNQLIRNAKCTDLEKLWDYKIRRSTIYYNGKQLQVIKII